MPAGMLDWPSRGTASARLLTGLHSAIEIDAYADMLRIAHKREIERLIGAPDVVEAPCGAG